MTQPTFEYDPYTESLLERSPTRFLRYLLTRHINGFWVDWNRYGFVSSWWNRQTKTVHVRKTFGTGWGNFCALYAMYVARFQTRERQRKWNPQLWKDVFEAQLVMQASPTLRRSKIVNPHGPRDGFKFFEWLSSIGSPDDEGIYDWFDNPPPAPWINASGRLETHYSWKYRKGNPKTYPRLQVVMAYTRSFPNQYSAVGPYLQYTTWPGWKVATRYKIGLHSSGKYWIKDYSQYRTSPAGGHWSGWEPYQEYRMSDEIMRQAPFVETRMITRTRTHTWGPKKGQTETWEEEGLWDTHLDQPLDRNEPHVVKWQHQYFQNLPPKTSFLAWKNRLVNPEDRRWSALMPINENQVPKIGFQTYLSINFANGLLRHLPEPTEEEMADRQGQPIFYSID